MKEIILLLGEILRSQGITKTVFAIYGLFARFGFEFALPVYALFAFNTLTATIIWSLFLIWQVSSFYLAKCIKNAREEMEANKLSEKE